MLAEISRQTPKINKNKLTTFQKTQVKARVFVEVRLLRSYFFIQTPTYRRPNNNTHNHCDVLGSAL